MHRRNPAPPHHHHRLESSLRRLLMAAHLHHPLIPVRNRALPLPVTWMHMLPTGTCPRLPSYTKCSLSHLSGLHMVTTSTPLSSRHGRRNSSSSTLSIMLSRATGQARTVSLRLHPAILLRLRRLLRSVYVVAVSTCCLFSGLSRLNRYPLFYHS